MLDRQAAKPAALCLILVALFVWPIIDTGILYRDDAFRAVHGVASWWWLGRPLADFIMHVVAMDPFVLPNMAPLPQVLAAACIFATCLITAHRVFGTISYVGVAASFSAIANPFVIENLMYSYDALPMMLAVLLSVIAADLATGKVWWRYVLSAIFLIASLSLYQAGTNAYLCLTTIIVLLSCHKEGIKGVIGIIKPAAIFFAAIAGYYLTVYAYYGKNSRAGTLGLDNEGITKLFENIGEYSERVNSVIGAWSYSIILTALSAAFLLAIFVNIHWKRPSLCPTLILTLTAPLLIAVASIGPLLLLREGFSSYRLMGSAGFVVVFMLATIYRARWVGKATIFLAGIMAAANISLAFNVGSAAGHQRDYEMSSLQTIRQQLDDNWNYYGERRLHVIGSFDMAPITSKRGQFGKFIESVITPSPYWVANQLLYSKGVTNVDVNWSNAGSEYAARACKDQERRQDGINYSLSGFPEHVYILLPKRSEKCKEAG